LGSRREFLKKTSALAALGFLTEWAAIGGDTDRLGNVLPKRKLIRNGEKTTAFCLGGYHAGISENPEDACQLVERAMELGVRFYDCARVYHKGRSEEYYGKFLTPKYRDQIFLMTKSASKNAADAKKDLDLSLSALKTDYVDLWQIHTLTTKEDADNRLKDGVLDVFLEAKEKKKARYVGFTAHQNPSTIIYFLEVLKQRGLELDTCQMPLNVCDSQYESFQKEALPVLLEREYGVIAMKTMAGGSMMGKRIDTTPAELKTEDIPDVVGKTGITYAQLHQYVYALPVSALCSGCDTVPKLDENVKVLTDLKNLTRADMEQLEKMVEPYAGYNVENYKRVF
jgi:predicted aldo/keto reductase-like oxidoreductase